MRPGARTTRSGAVPKREEYRDGTSITGRRYHLTIRRYDHVVVTTAVMIGAGQRGFYTYGGFASERPDLLRFIAVVDPDPARRERFARGHPGVDEFATVEEWLAPGQIADVAIVASPDRYHYPAARGAMELGYDVLLEKPMASTLAETVALVQVAEQMDSTLAVAHVLRYTPFFSTLHRVVTSGLLGEIITVEHRENVWAFHMAHSFVRGNWAVAGQSSPMIVQKCSHDLDILNWNLGSPVARLSSVGSLLHFRPENAPPGATPRCTDGCPAVDCPFDARKYLSSAWTGWPVHVLTDDLSRDGRLEALAKGPWGRCVYTAGSDVVDHQIVAMQLESGASVVLTMHGHSAEEARTMRYDGSKATLRARFGSGSVIEITDHASGITEQIPIEDATGGHGGGDQGLLQSFISSRNQGATSLTSAAESLESHVLAFAAEEARLTSKTIDMTEFRRRAWQG